MNLYFIVEGKTELKVYPDWLSYLLPELRRVNKSSKVERNNYFLMTAGGYPAVYELLGTALEEIALVGKFDYLVLCLDAEENTVDALRQEVHEKVEELLVVSNLSLGSTKLKVIVQNRCIETWFLGNCKIYSRQPQEPKLLNYTRYHNVSTDCPESMGKYNYDTHAHFHLDYLKELLAAKNMKYSKTMPGDTQTKYYLQELQNRASKQSDHLPTFQYFLEFCELVKATSSSA